MDCNKRKSSQYCKWLNIHLREMYCIFLILMFGVAPSIYDFFCNDKGGVAEALVSILAETIFMTLVLLNCELGQ